jgi:hypothetical protein
VVKGWIDRELDHKMILRHDDPLVRRSKRWVNHLQAGQQSHCGAHRQTHLQQSRGEGLDIVAVRVWETPTRSDL